MIECAGNLLIFHGQDPRAAVFARKLSAAQN
jgi:hypothetical protein